MSSLKFCHCEPARGGRGNLLLSMNYEIAEPVPNPPEADEGISWFASALPRNRCAPRNDQELVRSYRVIGVALRSKRN